MLLLDAFATTERYEVFLRVNRTRALLSQSVEDGFCRSTKDIQSGLGQDRSMNRDFANLIRKDIIGTVHKHKNIPWKH